MSKGKGLLFIGLAALLVLAALVVVPFEKLSFADCDRILLDLDGKQFSTLQDVQSSIGLSDADFATFSNTFDLKVEGGQVTACPLEPEEFA